MSQIRVNRHLREVATTRILSGTATLEDFETAETSTKDWQDKMSYLLKQEIRVYPVVSSRVQSWEVEFKNGETSPDKKHYTLPKQKEQFWKRHRYIMNYLIYLLEQRKNKS